MKVKDIYVRDGNKFGKVISEWAEDRAINVISISLKQSKFVQDIDGALLFHEDHNFTKEDEETEKLLVKNNVPLHKVDINGTMAAINSNFLMWLDNHKPTSLLIIGENGVAKNINLGDFLQAI